MPDTSFIEKLRLQNIFPTDGSPRMGTPYGMPDLSKGMINVNNIQNQTNRQNQMNDAAEQERQARRMEAAAMALAQSGYRKPALPQIANSVANGPVGMNTVYDRRGEITPYQSGQLALQREKLNQTGDLGEGKLNLAERVAGLKSSDEEKNQFALEQIQRRGDITGEQIDQRGNIVSGQIEQRGNIGSRQIGERGLVQRDIQGMRGEQGLANIAARTAGTIESDAAKGIKGELPTQTKVRQINNAKELVNSRPDLAQYIEVDSSTGTVTNSAPPGSIEFQQINSNIYDSPAQDITLPTNKQPTPKKGGTILTNKTPKSTTPVSSKYVKVTVE